MSKLIFTYAVKDVDKRGASYDEFTKAGHRFLGLKKIDGEWNEVWESLQDATPES